MSPVETSEAREARERAFSERMKIDGDLGLLLCEHLWGRMGDTIHLGGHDFEIADNEEVPGYGDDDDYAVLLRRKSDGEIFEAEIDVSVNPVRPSAQVKP